MWEDMKHAQSQAQDAGETVWKIKGFGRQHQRKLCVCSFTCAAHACRIFSDDIEDSPQE